MRKDNAELFETIRSSLKGNGPRKATEKGLWKRFGTRCAALVLDSSGFTRATRGGGILHFLECLVRLRDIVEEAFDRHGALTFRPEADNIYAEFETVDQAFQASVEANRDLAAADIMLTDAEPFSICIGIGFGEFLRSRSQGVFGDEMNLASKLGEDIAAGGEILLTESAYRAISAGHKKHFDMRSIFISNIPLSYYHMSVPLRNP